MVVAKGHDKVLVIAVTVRTADPIMAERFSKPLEKELRILRESNAQVEVIQQKGVSLRSLSE